MRTAANPEPGLDYLVTLRAPLSTGAAVEVRYVPDREVLDAAALGAYLDALPGQDAAGPEALAALLLGDLLNELLPRWVRVAVTPPPLGELTQSIVMEDRRPGWDNPPLLARLAPL
ncbi:hypothetical protein C882_3639 [Caenispirillum salinarum AK4]|uniref:Uncharacterized protein n=1 Tax=Caenispirillum salinarum AK4 TaxID=1238182 RepID=K9GLF6_9PROT|nr:hypothetical protein C882_3639 [Caenispirillum salinarum AK4]